MKKHVFKMLILGLTMLFSLTAVAQVSAVTGQRQNGEMNATAVEDSDDTAGTRSETAKSKLEAARLKVCEKREEKIKSTMSRIVNRGEKQLDLFTKISERTQTFYLDKVLTLANYDELVAEVNAKKFAAQAALDAISDTIVDFQCDGTDPKGAATTFKEALKSEVAALKDYKTAVKNLIVGVKSAQVTTESEGQ